jgi:Ca-activated chloride channel family protein
MRLGFDQPIFIALAFMAVPFLLFVSRYFKPLFALDLPLGPPGGIAFKSPVNLKFLMRFLHTLELSAVFLLFIAASGPNFVHTEMIWLNRGADIFFVVDVSPSMAGLDMNGRSRFDVARELLHDFADRRPSDAIGLISVGEDAALMVPLTTDRQVLYSRLDKLAIGEMGDGTALGTGLALAALHINNSRAPRRVVVIITDGENNSGSIHPDTAAAMLGEMGVSLWVIGVGSSGLVPINYVDPLTNMRRTGTFDSRYDIESLKSLAESGRGQWIHAPQAEAFVAAFSQVEQGEMIIRRSGTARREEPLYAIFAVSAVLLLCGVRFVRRYVLGALL